MAALASNDMDQVRLLTAVPDARVEEMQAESCFEMLFRGKVISKSMGR